MDTVEVTLPLTGKKVVIRNYTTHGDDAKAQAALAANAFRNDDGTVQYPAVNFFNFNSSYVDSLVQSIDGDADVSGQLDKLRSADYDAVREAVDKVIEESSPKVLSVKQEAKNATATK